MAVILLVGINGPDRRNVRAALEGAGNIVLEAMTRQFLEFVDRRAVNIVVIDISPLRHAAHLVGIAELRQRHPKLPILAVCGGRDAEILLNIAVQVGANATLSKPFTGEQLLRAVARCLAGPKQP